MHIVKTLRKKILYVFSAVALLTGMMPLAIAAPAYAAVAITMNLVDPITGLVVQPAEGAIGYNVSGSIVEVTVTGDAVTAWTLLDQVPSLPAQFVGPTNTNTVRVVGVAGGETLIQASFATGPTIAVDKKWGTIDNTVIQGPQSVYVTWNEAAKKYTGTATVTDTVWGLFNAVNPPANPPLHVVQGAILNWYLINGGAVVPMASGEAPNLKATMLALPDATFVRIGTSLPSNVTETRTVTNVNGQNTIDLITDGEEAIQVVVIPEYPNDPQRIVTPEITTVNFWTREMPVVPEVRWVGEKIVLEKNFGASFANSGYVVNFKLENQSIGSLEGIGPGVNNQDNHQSSVWTTVGANGLTSAILISNDPGEAHVNVALYKLATTDPVAPLILENQHGFTVFFLKLESLTLQNVVGKRVNHNSGDWTPSNPWDTSLAGNPPKNVLAETLNVSQDTLVRANVRGWFTNSNPSIRPSAILDVDNSGTTNNGDLTLPAGRWILPDDWAALAGPNWKLDRLQWDIMDSPSDTIWAVTPQGPYNSKNGAGATVNTSNNVVGPFSPGLELPTPLGYNVTFTSPDTRRPYRTVVPNGVLETWDAPMPPAKIIYSINNVAVTGAGGYNIGNSGFFKPADKTGIYWVTSNSVKVYTNPFYTQNIPAHHAIPAFINNGGYDWDTFGTATSVYGPYAFWSIINRPNLNAPVATADPAGHPTVAEVYSDNHGEAMIYLNGDWNLNLTEWGVNGAVDVAPGATVGSSTIQAMADYPYLRVHQPILSNLVVKTWVWGGQILGADAQTFNDGSVQTANRIINTTGVWNTPTGTFPNEVAFSDKKMVWLWATDRDGQYWGVNGATVQWFVQGGGNSVIINTPASGPLSNYAAMGPASTTIPTMTGITLTNGFLSGTSGVITDPSQTIGRSVMRQPTAFERDLFAKFYPTLDATKYVVAGIELKATGTPHVVVLAQITSPDFTNGLWTGGTIARNINVDFAQAYPLDDQIRVGDSNVDGVVNMGDVTSLENMILGLKTKTVNADSNGDGVLNMGDVIRIERQILGLPN